jgi:hypothetical protein
MAIEDLKFAADQGRQYGTAIGVQFLKSFAAPVSDAHRDGWFDTLTTCIERDKQAIRDKGGSEDYVQAFVTGLFEAFNPYVSGFMFGRTIATDIYELMGSRI